MNEKKNIDKPINNSDETEKLLTEKSNELNKLKITKIYLANYKMFKNVTIELNKYLTVIAGINGTGKTTLLNFIDDFSNNIFESRENRDFIEIEYYDKKEKKSIVLTFEKSYLKNYVGTHRLIYKSPESRFFEKNTLYLPVNKDIGDIKKTLSNYLYNMVWVKKIGVEESYKKVREYINIIFEDLNIQIEFDSRDADGNLFFRNKKGEKFQIDDISTGEKTLLSKILNLYLEEVRDKVILIDEPELSLHPSWQNKVLSLYEKFAKENNCQIIIATHSPHIIGSAKNEYIRVLKFNEDNNIEVINDLIAYGRDVSWVLEEVMDAEHIREKTIVKKIENIEVLLNDEKYEEVEEEIDSLENVIGKYDNELVRLRTILEFDKD